MGPEPLQGAALVKIVNPSTPEVGRAATSNKVSLSVILIACNEASNIVDCLSQLGWATERIVVEHGSSDGTETLAISAGAEVLQTADWPGFGPQKNRALDRARCDWVLSIDADERVSPQLAREITEVVQRDSGSSYEIPRLTNFRGQWIRHCGWTPDHVVRLFRRGSARFSDDLVHERVLTDGASPGRLKSPLLHYSYPTPAEYWRKLERYSHAWAVQEHAEGRRVSMVRAAASGLMAFIRSYFFRLGFLDGAMGFAVCTMQAQAAYGKYFELYCLNRHHESPPV